ncbi:PhoX family protein [Suttonella ornithocola]|uniref:Predicted phosphatase n=1 Tax=Suttonella ornithocola TaxID=279832 RepID=A0A380MYT0_9GAMM|nr:PhoX family phosphatase [Suttonella ornithocola]SUO96841.1 Predicted phosphatase [Suttonella ornithocola]
MQVNSSRRRFLKTSETLSGAAFLGGFSPKVLADTPSKLLNFVAVPAAAKDHIVVPEGYRADVLISWGEPMFENAPSFQDDGSNTGSDQALQFGDNNDGMQYYDVDDKQGVLAINNEYINPETLYTHGGKLAKTVDEVLKGQNACGLSIITLEKMPNNQMRFNRAGQYNRRVTAHTPMEFSGPAKGNEQLKDKDFPDGIAVNGTFANCSSGKTPWGTYVTCEENFDDMFGASDENAITPEMKRYGIAAQSTYGWEKYDPHFDVAKHPNCFNHYGWVVEIDPLDPNHKPIKRTALGRFKHENVAIHVANNGHVVAYMGDDERGERIYKFVSRDKYIEGDRKHNMTLLDNGTLYVAEFLGGDKPLEGKGKWITLTHGENGFKDQADIAIYTRRAADYVNATTMDRPEWIAVNPLNGKVFCTLTNNSKRGSEKLPPNPANPRKDNIYGQIIRWAEDNDDHTSNRFHWDMFVMAGNPNIYPDSDPRSGTPNITKANTFNSPDGIGFDQGGRIWIQADGKYSNEGDYAGQGNNSMLCADPENGEIRRFLTGPNSCEITGLTFANNDKTMFVNIQHPGEAGDSTFPHTGKRPRSSVIMITKEDGGVIGA